MKIIFISCLSQEILGIYFWPLDTYSLNHFLIRIFPLHFQVLVSLSNPSPSFSISTLFSLGTPFAWKVVLLFYAWGFISLKVPSKVFKGPATPNGYIPLYSANGLQYYFVSLVLFLLFVAFGNPDLCTVGNFAWFFYFRIN